MKACGLCGKHEAEIPVKVISYKALNDKSLIGYADTYRVIKICRICHSLIFKKES